MYARTLRSRKVMRWLSGACWTRGWRRKDTPLSTISSRMVPPVAAAAGSGSSILTRLDRSVARAGGG